MAIQTEQELENELVRQLIGLGYSKANITCEDDIIKNLKLKLEELNDISLSDTEFKKVLRWLNKKSSVFERARTLRKMCEIVGDDGKQKYLKFIDHFKWNNNSFQVAQQITIVGTYENRYDVTLLINGLPLVQIELKRRDGDLKEAFKQIKRYHRHSYGASFGFFRFVQIFVISNGVDTKYFANCATESPKQTFFWADKENKNIYRIEPFADDFLRPLHISTMISKYIVLNDAEKNLMVLRPYQYHATEAIVDNVKTNGDGGYIWHTTGSGKTLTSFKTSQILTAMPQIHKVVFVVDRKDLDYQTMKEFNKFSDGSVDATERTKLLIDQFTDTFIVNKEIKTTKLIVTTIQKLNNAISKTKNLKRMAALKDKRMVFIFDECHRSQFGKTHAQIKDFFTNVQMYGFTGTPIFDKNAAKNELGKRTTKDLFNGCLHKYVITDAIKDENVLKFNVEYVGKYKEKKGSKNFVDIEVESIDTKEILESDKRIEKIVDYIINYHDLKTQKRFFTGMFCVSNIKMLIRYYEMFKRKKEAGDHDLVIGTIFSYGANEEDEDADGVPRLDIAADDDDEVKYKTSHSRDKLEEFIGDYNKHFKTDYSTKDSKLYYSYYKEISKRVKDKEIDILLVVSMFLTGFDSKMLNTMYVDKNLKHHGLIQAYSRTNRIVNERKSHGNIICFRNLKDATDKAISMFSNKDAKEVILIKPYGHYLNIFKTVLNELKAHTPTVDSIGDLISEEEEAEFVKNFRNIIRLRNVLESYVDFKIEDLEFDEKEFIEYKGKYSRLYDKVKNNRKKEKLSILDDIDFEVELIHRDEINVTYILQLLAKLKKEKDKEYEVQLESILALLSGEIQLKSKKELIEKFILEQLPTLSDTNDVPTAFKDFWDSERKQAFSNLCDEEKLHPAKIQDVIDNYMWTEKTPQEDTIIKTMEKKPSLLKRDGVASRILEKIVGFVETFLRTDFE